MVLMDSRAAFAVRALADLGVLIIMWLVRHSLLPFFEISLPVAAVSYSATCNMFSANS